MGDIVRTYLDGMAEIGVELTMYFTAMGRDSD